MLMRYSGALHRSHNLCCYVNFRKCNLERFSCIDFHIVFQLGTIVFYDLSASKLQGYYLYILLSMSNWISTHKVKEKIYERKGKNKKNKREDERDKEKVLKYIKDRHVQIIFFSKFGHVMIKDHFVRHDAVLLLTYVHTVPFEHGMANGKTFYILYTYVLFLFCIFVLAWRTGVKCGGHCCCRCC